MDLSFKKPMQTNIFEIQKWFTFRCSLKHSMIGRLCHFNIAYRFLKNGRIKSYLTNALTDGLWVFQNFSLSFALFCAPVMLYKFFRNHIREF